MAKFAAKNVVLKSGANITIRTAGPNDAAELLRFSEQVFRSGVGQVLLPNEFAPTLEQEIETLEKFENSKNEFFLIAECDGRIVGNIDFHAGKRARMAHVGWIGMSIVPDWRGRGLGTALFSEFLQLVKTIPIIEKINLRVLAYNDPDIGLYKKFGFREDGRKSKEVKLANGDYLDDVSMELMLK